MADTSIIAPLLFNLLTQTPLFLVWGVGLVVAFLRWQRHPRVSLLLVIALIGLGLDAIIGTSLSIWLPIAHMQSGWNVEQLGWMMGSVSVLRVLFGSVLWGLILVAVFSGRQVQPNVSVYEKA
ncbi:MAG: hypothetical protein GFH27_549349n32 [Chloroflexi bacterium AL-W]|nr:hypothetical protein [Chloroflexi bacterium AL-N1]NOK69930.1 hypothetical protein [Chloroflexi bacterium AL-N10]NOK73774.1 hypothetical protein [Chloroflexi bacterium AL-N5]NOK85462.1 hypothetical protein [Chloroflexi bacterium AL-W]NOK91663.1 hypothetical protein [Chloroflexi bacterium AL-N15]